MFKQVNMDKKSGIELICRYNAPAIIQKASFKSLAYMPVINAPATTSKNMENMNINIDTNVIIETSPFQFPVHDKNTLSSVHPDCIKQAFQ